MGHAATARTDGVMNRLLLGLAGDGCSRRRTGHALRAAIRQWVDHCGRRKWVLWKSAQRKERGSEQVEVTQRAEHEVKINYRVEFRRGREFMYGEPLPR